MIKPIQNNFLLWRLPDQATATLYDLESTSESISKSIIITPFRGKAQRFQIINSSEVNLDHLTITAPEQLIPIGEETQKDSHIKLVGKAIEQLNQEGLKKVVLARNKRIKRKPNPKSWFSALADEYPTSCVFLFHSPESGMWMGATPERLLSVENGIAKATSLAGTRPVNTNVDWGDKELEEQNLVTQSIQTTFATKELKNTQTSPVETHKAGPVEHLFCEVIGEMPLGLNAAELAEALHPTPAVGGLPMKEALEFISKHEKIDREFYAGYFGLVDKSEASFYVNLRSMKLFANGVVLYAGGGITAASDPEAEWEETERKLQTLLRFI